jgi:hypothetical protein
MRPWIGALARWLARGAGGCLLGGALLVPPAMTTTSPAIDQINSMSMRPLPMVTPRPVARETNVWVPERVILVPGAPTGAVVPGHWERLTPDGSLYVPPLTVVQPSTGSLLSFPAGSYSPTDGRPYGP